jgi:serine/threonine protein kinase/O-acetyl-ADP-ribose deacetylase (regulator of RNase III)
MTRNHDSRGNDGAPGTGDLTPAPRTHGAGVEVEKVELQPVDGSGVRSSDADGREDLDEIVRRVARSPSRAVQSEPLPGTRWGASGRFVIERRVGAGGMGTVFEARDELLGRVVALKVLNGDRRDGEAGGSPILQEARLAARVEHERIARVYDVGEHEGQLFVAMEFVRGATLREFINENPLLGIYSAFHRVLSLAIEIAEGLAELHANGVIHRDLKPENVMLSSQGIKVLDFGLARHQAHDPEADRDAFDAARAQALPRFSGTPGYMAPEQLEGRALDPRVDVFALGVILYELVTGTRPFAGNRPLDLLDAMAKPPLFSLEQWGGGRSSHNQDLALCLKEATRCMLSRDPGDRFLDGSEALQALQYVKHRLVAPSRLSSRREIEGDILWVDDEPENNWRERRMFEDIGLRVASVTSTDMAIRYLRRRAATESERKLVAVISDMDRREGPREGYALLTFMRELGDATPFFVYSSAAILEHKRGVAACGGQGCTDDDVELFKMVVSSICWTERRLPSRIEAVRADITSLRVDAIVNCASDLLVGATGVDRAIHRAAGQALRHECRHFGGCATGDAKITGGHQLKARFVIHTVGPVWRGGDRGEEQILASCYDRSLALAREHGILTIAFPCISTGARGYPMVAAARVAVRSVARALENSELPARVTLCAFSSDAVVALEAALSEIAGDDS